MKSSIKVVLFCVALLFSVINSQQDPNATINQLCVMALNQLYSQCGMENLVDNCKDKLKLCISETSVFGTLIGF